MASEIRVNKIENRSGLGTVTFADTGVDLAGIVTATTFSGSGASLTALPAAQITGTLPAISGANLTALNGSNIASGTVADARISTLTASKLSGALPAISAASLTQIPAANIVGVCTAGFGNASGAFSQGITEVDQWRLSTTLSNNGDNNITANWERNDTEFEKIGTGLSESSGVYSFPSTGKYLIMFRGTGTGNDARYIGIHMYVSTNSGSNYTYRGESYGSGYDSGGTSYASYSFDIVLDVTNHSTFRFYWRASSWGTCNFLGSSNAQMTGFTCIKLGDT